MTPEKQRIAILEFMGWKFERLPDGRICAGESPKGRIVSGLKLGAMLALSEAPDAPNDLNAMHEAEKLLNSAPLKAKYYIEMSKFRRGMMSISYQIELPMICATAPQRAEALLRAIGKWED